MRLQRKVKSEKLKATSQKLEEFLSKGGSLKRHSYNFLLLAFSFCLLTFCKVSAHAGITNASLSTYTIPYETAGTSGTYILYQVNAIADVEIDIYFQRDISDFPGTLVASIQAPNVPANTPQSVFWNALWLLGGDIGRTNGSFQAIVSATSAGTTTSSSIGQLLQITSLDIHNVSATPSFDADNNPAFPYVIQYALAKDSLVTASITDALGNPVRTLLNNKAKPGEQTVPNPNVLYWNGLDDNGHPVPLGIYTLTITATDALGTDHAFPRTRSLSVQSLASLETDLQKTFEQNAFIYPNPVRNGQMTLQARAVRDNATIKFQLYTISGDLVREKTFSNVSTGTPIDPGEGILGAVNQAGKPLARGLYYYVVRETDAGGTLQTVKKVAVIP